MSPSAEQIARVARLAQKILNATDVDTSSAEDVADVAVAALVAATAAFHVVDYPLEDAVRVFRGVWARTRRDLLAEPKKP